MSVTVDFDLRAEMRRFADDSTEADPGKLAQEFVTLVPELALRECLATALRDGFRQLARQERQPPSSSNKWQRAAEDQASGAVFWARWRVWAGEDWKMLPDCDAADLNCIVADYQRRSAEQAAWAEKYERLRRYLKRSRSARTVAELDHQRVSEILDA